MVRKKIAVTLELKSMANMLLARLSLFLGSEPYISK